MAGIVTRHGRGICFTVCFFLFVFCSVNDFSTTRGSIHAKVCMRACGRTLVTDVSSPLLGVSGPQRTEKGENEIFVNMGVNREFLHFGGF